MYFLKLLHLRCRSHQPLHFNEDIRLKLRIFHCFVQLAAFQPIIPIGRRENQWEISKHTKPSCTHFGQPSPKVGQAKCECTHFSHFQILTAILD